MSYNLTKFEQTNLSTGVQSFTSDFSPDVRFSIDTKNVTTGIRQGVGPRFGMSPIPGQQDSEGAAAQPNSILQSENVDSAFTGRSGYYGCYRVMTESLNVFCWILGKNTEVDVVIGSTLAGIVFTPASTITAGMPTPSQTSLDLNYKSPAFWNLPTNLLQTGQTWLKNKLKSPFYILSTAHIKVTGKEIPQPWLLGKSVAAAINVNACSKPNFNYYTAVNAFAGGAPSADYVAGSAYQIQSSKIDLVKQTFTMYELDKTLAWAYEYKYTDVDMTTFVPTPSPMMDISISQLTPQTATAKTAAGAPGTVTTILYNNPKNTINCGYEAVLIAGDSPFACAFQNWDSNQDGTYNKYFDLTDLEISPKSRANVVDAIDGQTKPTCFLGNLYNVYVAGTGLFKKDTVYEITFSYYNKKFNYETNVGAPIKIKSAAADNFAQTISATDVPILFPTASPFTNSIPVNDYSLRFYYRVNGSFEWIPCGEFELARAFCVLAGGNTFQIGVSAVAQLPGGQPGGFNDYSPIQKDSYDCVTTWQGRAFWSSKKSLVFSMRDNIFAYPIRNSVSCPSGEFRGITVHAFPGQADQRGRMIVWGSDECYIATFTGDPILQTVQVSPTTAGDYPLDGSDFVMERWTTNTAFSHRAAVVADGELWYWGAKGIFHDNGTDFGDRVSINIEPDIFTIYDPSQASTIFGHYFGQTKEIYWFYAPKTAPTVTHAIVLNTMTGGIYRAEFNCRIDSAQDISIENTADTQTNLTGKRTIISVRKDTGFGKQRPYFFDIKNRSGDLEPGCEAMVKQVATVGLSSVLTIASGFGGLVVNVNDYIAIHQATDYAGVTISDQIVKVTNVALPNITVTRVSGALLPNFTAAARKNYFPIWIAPLTQIPYRIKTQYWSPTGMQSWYRFLFTHLQFGVTLWPSMSNYDLNLGYRTPITGTDGSKVITLADNSDGNCQIYSPMPGDLQRFEGQGIRYDIAGVHNGGEWVLQYLATHAEAQLDGDNLMTFEG